MVEAMLWWMLALPQALPSAGVEHPAALSVLLDNGSETGRDVDELKAAVADLLALDESATLALVSRDNGFYGLRCPVSQDYVQTFDFSDPDHVYTADRRHRYPHPDFPETEPHSGTNLAGEPVTWHYHKQEGSDYAYFFSALLRHHRHHALADAAQDLGRLYHATGDEAYARRAAVILVALAEAYPHWTPRYDHVWYGRYFVDERPWKGGVWARGLWDEIPIAAVFAYDLIYDSPIWQQLAAERNLASHEALREPVETWFRRSHRMMLEMHEDGGGRFGNLHPYAIRHAVATGRVLNDPLIVHSMLPWIDGVVADNFHADGMWREGSVDYHGQTVWNLDRGIRALRGWSDPAGWTHPETGERLDDPNLLDRHPILTKARGVSSAFTYPDGRRVTIHDTHWRPRGGEIEPRANLEFNHYGHFSLNGGEGDATMQVHLHFPPLERESHYHDSPLSLILWAAGSEVLPDIGYATDRRAYRYFATGRLSHNLSYVGWNEPAPEPKESEGHLANWDHSSLLAYADGRTSGGRVQMVEAETLGPARRQADVSQRLVALIAADAQRSYVVDLFRLAGGDWHESILRAAADELTDETIDRELTPRPGTLAGEDIEYGQIGGGVGYRALVHELRSADGARPTTVTWTGQESGVSVRGFLNPLPGAQLTVGRAPLIRPSNNRPPLRDEHQGPYLQRRRESGEASTFGAVYDCWAPGAGPVVEAVEWLTPTPADPHAVALRVSLPGAEHLIYASRDTTPRTIDGVEFAGRFAMLARPSNAAPWAWLHGEGHVRGAGVAFQGHPDLAGELTAVDDAARTVDVAGLDAGAPDLVGTWLRVVHGDGTGTGYRIEAATPIAGGARLTLHDAPAFERVEGGMRMLAFPGYTIEGPQRVEIRRGRAAGR